MRVDLIENPATSPEGLIASNDYLDVCILSGKMSEKAIRGDDQFKMVRIDYSRLYGVTEGA